ncbi:MAG TPA: hypothetical protein VFF46_13115 [Kribbella sp.]|nr:hypothetical protein [Kribbella sp.]
MDVKSTVTDTADEVADRRSGRSGSFRPMWWTLPMVLDEFRELLERHVRPDRTTYRAKSSDAVIEGCVESSATRPGLSGVAGCRQRDPARVAAVHCGHDSHLIVW